MKYLFGPVNSRRLGLSLGIDLLPFKICNYNCIYCEVGPNSIFTNERKEYVPAKDIISEIDVFLADESTLRSLDVFTITASGEPTLNSGLGKVIRHIKGHTNKPVAVLTNGSLFHLAEVRKDLLQADIVIPSLDAIAPKSFRKINRPLTDVKPHILVEELHKFNKNYKGKFWLEILLVKDVNDSEKDLSALKEAIACIQPDRVQLNTVARPPLESFAKPLSRSELEKAAEHLSESIEIITDYDKIHDDTCRSAASGEVLNMLKRRPCTFKDICLALNQTPENIDARLAKLSQRNLITIKKHNGKEYYQSRK